MDATKRLLALVIEMITVPAEVNDKKCRAVFDVVSETHGISNFSSDGSAVQMSSKQGKKGMVKYIIMKDRVIASYEFCENSMNYYRGLVSDFIRVLSENTGISGFLMQNITIRRLINIPGIADSRDYIIRNMLSFDEKNMACFARPLHMFGTRIFFPAVQGDTSSYDAKIETSMDDYKTFFVENRGIFPQAFDARKGISLLDANIEKTEEFINKNIMEFITQFI